jgi:hypothetical protein
VDHVGPQGERTVSPTASTTYVLTASGYPKPISIHADIEVRPPATPPAEAAYADIDRLYRSLKYKEALNKCQVAKLNYSTNARISGLCRQIRETFDILNGKEMPKGGS